MFHCKKYEKKIRSFVVKSPERRKGFALLFFSCIKGMLKWQSTLKTSSDPFYSFWWIGEKTFLGVFARLVKERAAGQFCAENILLVDNSPRLWEPITRLQRISPHHWTDNLLKWIFYVQASQLRRRINIDNLGLFFTQLEHFRHSTMAKKHFVLFQIYFSFKQLLNLTRYLQALGDRGGGGRAQHQFRTQV